MIPFFFFFGLTEVQHSSHSHANVNSSAPPPKFCVSTPLSTSTCHLQLPEKSKSVTLVFLFLPATLSFSCKAWASWENFWICKFYINSSPLFNVCTLDTFSGLPQKEKKKKSKRDMHLYREPLISQKVVQSPFAVPQWIKAAIYCTTHQEAKPSRQNLAESTYITKNWCLFAG